MRIRIVSAISNWPFPALFLRGLHMIKCLFVHTTQKGEFELGKISNSFDGLIGGFLL
jgi:hypothetical protein